MPDSIRSFKSLGRIEVKPVRRFENEEAELKKQLDFVRGQRNQDMLEGRKRGEQLFAEGTLGRVAEGPNADMADIIAQRRANLAGFTPEELNALHDQENQTIANNTNMAMRTLRGEQGRAGYSGGIAAGQVGQVIRADARSRAEADRDIFLKQMEARRSALGELENSQGAANKDELARQQYNQAQKNAELQGRLTTEFGYAGLGAAERGGVMQKIVGQEQAQALQNQAQKSGGKK